MPDLVEGKLYMASLRVVTYNIRFQRLLVTFIYLPKVLRAGWQNVNILKIPLCPVGQKSQPDSGAIW